MHISKFGMTGLVIALILSAAMAGIGQTTSASTPACSEASCIAGLYQVHSEICSLAILGTTAACDRYLRDISRKMIRERAEMNPRLSQFYATSAGCPLAQPASCVVSQLAIPCGSTFDEVYVSKMKCLLLRERALAAAWQTSQRSPAQAQASDKAFRIARAESDAFKRWQDTGFLTFDNEARFCATHWTSPACCP